MKRPMLLGHVALVSTLLVSLLHLSVNGVHAQQPAAAPTGEPAAVEDTPSSSSTQATSGWRPRRWPKLDRAPGPALQQARDTERPELDLSARPERPRHTGLLIGGVTLWMTSYLVTAIAAGVVSSINASDCAAGDVVRSCDDGNLMLIPLAGPFLASRSASEQVWLAGPQILGAALLVAGIFHYASRPGHAHATHAGLTLSPYPLRDGALLAARLTF